MSVRERADTRSFLTPGEGRRAHPPERAKSRPLLFNLSAVTSAEIVSRVAQVVSISVMSRFLGPEGFGVVGTAWALFYMALPMAQIAPELIGMREIARRPRRLSVIGEITSLKVLAALLAAAACSGYAMLLHAGHPIVQWQIVVQSAVLFGMALSVAWVFRGLQRWEFHAVLRMSQALSMALLLFLLLKPFPHPLTVPLVELATFLAAGTAGLLALRRWIRRRGDGAVTGLLPASLVSVRQTLRRHGPTFGIQGFTALCAAINLSVCIPEAAFFLTAGQVGLLATAIRLTMAITAVYLLAIQLFFPILSRDSSHRPERARETAAGLLCYTAVATGVGYGLLAVLAEPLTLFLFGPEFRDATRSLQLIGLSVVPMGIGAVYMYALLAAGKEGVVLATTVSASALIVTATPVAFHLWPVPHAAVVITAALCLQTLAMAVYCHRRELVGRGAYAPWRLQPARIKAFLGAYSTDGGDESPSALGSAS